MGDRVIFNRSILIIIDDSRFRFSTQENITALLEELQLETYPQYRTGQSLAELQRRIYKYTLPIPYVSLLSFLESIYSVFRVSFDPNDASSIVFI
jgi:hypothetical protein